MIPPSFAPAPAPGFAAECRQCWLWARGQPGQALLLLGLLASLVYFYGFGKFFNGGQLSTAGWALSAWNPENSQEHSIAVLPVALGLLWWHRRKIVAAEKRPSNSGMWFLAAGILIFVLGVRSLQPRFPLFALPLIVYGAVRFVWGREVGRVFIFPCLFLLFMVPIGGLVQGTVTLQLLVSSSVQFLSSMIGVQIETIGTNVRALDGSFNFEIAEGCSGIRSLMAMSTLAALYVHFTQRVVWKQVVIFAGSVLFALVGNIGRIFTVVLFARFISPEIASGLYHDYSGFLFFPIAVASMVGFSSLLEVNWRASFARWLAPEVASSPATAEVPAAAKEKAKDSSVSYDY